MNRAFGLLAIMALSIWLVAHVLYIGPWQTAAEGSAVWIFGIAAASLVTAAVVLLAVGLALGRTGRRG